MNAADAVASGLCDGRCMVATSPAKGCTCSCRGRYHGSLADSSLEGGATSEGTPTLRGMFFHKINPECGWCVRYQGEVIADMGTAGHMVRYFSWLHGFTDDDRHIIKFNFDLDVFYPDADAMNFAYEYGAMGNRELGCDVHREAVIA